MGQKNSKVCWKKKLFNPIKSSFSQTCKDDVPPHILPSRQNTILLGAACAKPLGLETLLDKCFATFWPYTQAVWETGKKSSWQIPITYLGICLILDMFFAVFIYLTSLWIPWTQKQPVCQHIWLDGLSVYCTVLWTSAFFLGQKIKRSRFSSHCCIVTWKRGASL